MTDWYVCGFLFDRNRENVLLVRKTHPAWQAGFANGIGGKVEPGESPAQAMAREFDEEANGKVEPAYRIEPAWEQFATVSVPAKSTRVVFYRAFVPFEDLKLRHYLRTDTDEHLFHVPIGFPGAIKPLFNLRWLVPMALDDDIREIVHVTMEAS